MVPVTQPSRSIGRYDDPAGDRTDPRYGLVAIKAYVEGKAVTLAPADVVLVYDSHYTRVQRRPDLSDVRAAWEAFRGAPTVANADAITALLSRETMP